MPTPNTPATTPITTLTKAHTLGKMLDELEEGMYAYMIGTKPLSAVRELRRPIFQLVFGEEVRDG